MIELTDDEKSKYIQIKGINEHIREKFPQTPSEDLSKALERAAMLAFSLYSDLSAREIKVRYLAYLVKNRKSMPDEGIEFHKHPDALQGLIEFIEHWQ